MNLDFIITGTGRCGTLNVAHNFTRAGIHCGHESIFGTGGIALAQDRLQGKARIHASDISTKEGLWFDPLQLKADSSYMAAPFLFSNLLKDTTVVHLIRHPFKVISSFVKNLNYFGDNPSQWEKFIYSYAPSLLTLETQLERACEYYVVWNDLIANRADVVHKIEDDVNLLFEKLHIEKIEYPSDERNIFRGRDSDFGTIDLPTTVKNKLLNMAERYGYI